MRASETVMLRGETNEHRAGTLASYKRTRRITVLN
jgi:hypothetical protein